jgi:CheY-like chemotaxis protein
VDKAETVLWHGYARVSTDDQDLRMQIEALARAGVDPDRIYQDKASGKNTKRTGLQDMLAHVRSGEGIMVWRFDRLSRSIRDLIMLFDDLEQRGIQLRSIHEQLDTTTPMGRLMFQLAGMLAEFERGDFDLVVADIGLPGMDGLSLLAEIMRRSPATICGTWASPSRWSWRDPTPRRPTRPR